MLGKEKTQPISPGYIVAAVVASIAGIILLCLALFWIWRRRRTPTDNEKYGGSGSGGRSPVDLNRNTSVHSKLGLLDSASLPTINTRFSHHNPGFSTDSSSPGSMGARRKSNPLDFDQRLNPTLLMVHDNGSRNSIQTLEDHRDYGRMLKVQLAASHLDT
jgi:cell wall integrity and stress response component